MRDAYLHLLLKVKNFVNPHKVMSNVNLLLKEMIVVHPLRKGVDHLRIIKDLPRVMQGVTLSKLLIQETLTHTMMADAHPNTMKEVPHPLVKREDLPSKMRETIVHPLVKKGDHLKIKRDLHKVKKIDVLQ